MSARRPAAAAGGDGQFDDLMAEVMATAGRFGHREHVHLTWLAVRRFGVRAAVGVVSDGIQLTARYAGAPQKYHATVSRAWVELVGYHAAERGDVDFAAFAGRWPDYARQAPAHPPLPSCHPGQSASQSRLGRAGPGPIPLAGDSRRAPFVESWIKI